MKSSQLKVSRELTFTYRVRHRYDTVHGRLPVETTDEVGEVIEDGQVVLDGDYVVVGREQLTDDLGSLQPLLNVQVTRRFIKHVSICEHQRKQKCQNGRHAHVRLLYARHRDREPLQLPTRQLRHLPGEHVIKLQIVAHLLLVVALQLRVEHLRHGERALDRAGDVVHVLRLDERLQVILQHLREVVLQLGAAEVLQDLLPVRRVLRHKWFKPDHTAKARMKLTS